MMSGNQRGSYSFNGGISHSHTNQLQYQQHTDAMKSNHRQNGGCDVDQRADSERDADSIAAASNGVKYRTVIAIEQAAAAATVGGTTARSSWSRGASATCTNDQQQRQRRRRSS
jgi:hypothetical protein